MPATKWAIFRVSKLSQDFANSLDSLPKEEHEITAVFGWNKEKVEEFARKFNIPNTFDDPKKMANDKSFDVVYINTVLPNHLNAAKLFIEAGKHVLVQKPLGLTAAMAKEMVELAKKKKVFLMEADATRFLPLHGRVREIISEKKLGDPKNIVMTLGMKGRNVPDRRLAKKWHGGGTVLEYGQTCIQFALMVLGVNEKPESITATCLGVSENGVDLGVSVCLKFSQRRIATFITDLRVDMPCEAVVNCKEGALTLNKEWWCGTNLTIQEGEKINTETFPMPKGAKHVFNTLIGPGLSYQIQEVRKCLEEGKTESEVMPLATSTLVAEIAEDINKQIKISFDDVKIPDWEKKL